MTGPTTAAERILKEMPYKDGNSSDLKMDARWFLSRAWKGAIVVLVVLGLIFTTFNFGLQYVGDGKTFFLFGREIYFPPAQYRIVFKANWLLPVLILTFLIVINRFVAHICISKIKNPEHSRIAFDAFLYSGEALSILAMKFSGGLISPLCLYFFGHIVPLSSVTSRSSMTKHIAFISVLFLFVAVSEYTGFVPHSDFTVPPILIYKEPAYFHLITMSVIGYLMYIGLGSWNVFRKFSERVQTLEALRTKNIVFDVSIAGNSIADKDGAVTEVNDTFLRLWGCSSKNEVIGKPLSHFFNDPEAATDILMILNETGRCDRDFVARKIDGTTFIVHCQATKLWDGNGQFIGYQSSVMDITERRKAAELQLKMKEQEKHAVVGKMAGRMAHDFNNMLTTIIGISQLIQLSDLSPNVKKDVDTILESAMNGKNITNGLLQFAKDQEPKLSLFDLNEKIDQVIRMMWTDLTGIDVNVEYESDLEDVIADVGLLNNAMINLIQNSIHAMSKTMNPKLSIKTYSENDSICIEVEDNGCGIPVEWRDKIYEPTVTLKGSRDSTRAYMPGIKGSGYGMANVKRCVEKHRGTISFESEVNKGTKFKISLPLVRDSFKEEEIRSIQKHHVVEGKTILIVEDEPALARILYLLLEKFNHNLDIASEGRMALECIKNKTYDAISLDFMLPDINGMEVYRHIRETNKNIPIIFVSGNFEFMESMIDLKKADPKVDHLGKPFDTVEYINKLHEWLV